MGTMFSRIVYPRSGEPEVRAAAMPLKTIPAPCAIPLDNEVVHTSGNENIYGIKFFRDQVYVGDSTSYTSMKSNGDFLKKLSGGSTVYTYSLPVTGGTLVPNISISPQFSSSSSYSIGDMCTSGGVLYKCINAHTGNWNASHFQQVSLANDVSDIDQALDQLLDEYTPSGSIVEKANSSAIANPFSTSSAYASGDKVMYQGNLYECTATHSAGAWNASHFAEKTVISIIGSGGGGGGGGSSGGYIVSINVDGKQSAYKQAVIVDGIRYPGKSMFFYGSDNQDPNSTCLSVPQSSTISIDFDDYEGDCSVNVNGSPATYSGGNLVVPSDRNSIVYISFSTCLSPDTLILMHDQSSKQLSSIRPGDVVATPFGPDEVTEVSFGTENHKDIWSFSDGTKVETVGRHRFYNHELGEPMYLEAWNMGEHALCSDGTTAALISHEKQSGNFPHGTLFTKQWNLYYANGLLAGNRRSRRFEELCPNM